MKALTVIVLAILISLNCFGQMVLEQKYTQKTNEPFYEYELHNTGEELMWAKWEFQSDPQTYPEVILYHTNHSIYKRVDLTKIKNIGQVFSIKTSNNQYFPITNRMYNDDDKMEIFLYGFNKYQEDHCIIVVNEDGEELQRIVLDTGTVVVNVYNLGIQGTRMTTKTYFNYGASSNGNEIMVFNMKGVLPTSPKYGIEQPLIAQSGVLGNFYPNPANTITKIYYELPENEKEGDFNIYNVEGKLIKTFKVDNGFKTLEISTNDLIEGSYYGQLICKNKKIGGRKLIVIH